MSLTIYCLNGPNLNLLGEREPAVYGKGTLADLEKLTQDAAEEADAKLIFRQSNHEGELVDWIQEARRQAGGLIINAGGYTHTSAQPLTPPTKNKCSIPVACRYIKVI